MLVLGIDTTSNNLGIGIVEDTKQNFFLSITQKNSENLTLILKKIFDLTDYKINELNGISVITGPGSYTGIRIGISIAKTISQVQKIPIVGINKLIVLIEQAPSNCILSPILDIRRNEIYTALVNKRNNEYSFIIEPCIQKVKDWEDKLKNINEKILIIGDNYLFNDKNFFSYYEPCYNSVITASFIGLKEIKLGKGKNFYEINPFYLREVICF